MNILFIEDESELCASGVAQLEAKGHTVYPTHDLSEARAVLADETISIDLIISDHMLPDGFGIQFVIETRSTHPKLKSVIVSGCLTGKDIETLKEHEISYYRKPLLYGKVIEEVRRKPMATAPVYVAPQERTPPVVEEPKPPKKKRFGFW